MHTDIHEYDLRALAVFCLYVESGTLQNAAEALGMSQPAMSVWLQKLRDACGFVLFEKPGRSLVLTPAGQALYRRGRAILDAIDEFNNEVFSCDEEPAIDPMRQIESALSAALKQVRGMRGPSAGSGRGLEMAS